MNTHQGHDEPAVERVGGAPPGPSAAADFLGRVRALVSDGGPWSAAVPFLAQSLALHFRRSSQSVWLHGDEPRLFEEAHRLIGLLKQSLPQHRLIMTSGDPETFAWLKGRFVDEARFPSPVGWGPVVRRMFGLLSPKVLIVLESPAGIDRGVLRRVWQAGIPVLVFGAGGRGCGEVHARELAALRAARLCVRDERFAGLLRGAGVPADRIAVTGDPAFEAVPPVVTARREYLRKELRLQEHAHVILAEGIGTEEEAVVADLFAGLRRSHPELVLLIEPRRRRQVRSLSRLLGARGLRVGRRSLLGEVAPADVILMDLPGEVAGFYPAVDCVFAGGSLGGGEYPVGPVGALLAGTPVVYGPRVPPQAAAVRVFLDREMVHQATAENLGAVVDSLLSARDGRGTLAARTEEVMRQYAGASERAFDAFKPFLPAAQDLRPVAARKWRVRGLVQKLGDTPLGNLLIELRSRRRIDTWDQLAERLGHPRTIICLGNGPSCEDPRLKEIQGDCLFRVNYLWKDRGFMVHPDMVFVGNPDTVRKVPHCLFAFRHIAIERATVLEHLLHLRPKPLEFFTLERVPSLASGPDEFAQPTNGPLMVATAAALQPERIVIAGIDLFSHPDGRYPGDVRSRNQYGAAHSRDTDVRLIRRALTTYRGEVVILSDILRASLAELEDEAEHDAG